MERIPLEGIQKFTWNPVKENCYVVWDETGECLIVDPGCSSAVEQNELVHFLKDKRLQPVKLLNTHCHFDHVLGNRFVFDNYQLLPIFHALELPVLDSIPAYAAFFGIDYQLSPRPEEFLHDNERVCFGKSSFTCLLTPGHSPGSLSFYFESRSFVLSGDALFYESIGRTDLPGADSKALIKGIKSKLLTLDRATKVFPGHGRETTVIHEQAFNPFLRE